MCVEGDMYQDVYYSTVLHREELTAAEKIYQWANLQAQINTVWYIHIKVKETWLYLENIILNGKS